MLTRVRKPSPKEETNKLHYKSKESIGTLLLRLFRNSSSASILGRRREWQFSFLPADGTSYVVWQARICPSGRICRCSSRRKVSIRATPQSHTYIKFPG